MLTTNINIQDQLINDQMTLLFDNIMLYLYSEPQRTTVSSQRVQFPVSRAWTCTVHKVQGLTLYKVQVLTLDKVQGLNLTAKISGIYYMECTLVNIGSLRKHCDDIKLILYC